jgi:hypothetical protein
MPARPRGPPMLKQSRVPTAGTQDGRLFLWERPPEGRVRVQDLANPATLTRRIYCRGLWPLLTRCPLPKEEGLAFNSFTASNASDIEVISDQIRTLHQRLG